MAAALVALLGLLVLVGWMADIGVLKSILPVWVSMKANTAFCFVLFGLALSALQQGRADQPGVRLAAQVMALLLGLTAGATLAEYAFGVDLHIDQLLFQEPQGTIGTFAPGRMAANTAICFLLLSISLLAINRKDLGGLRFSEGLAIAVAALAGQNILGYAMGADFNIGAGVFTRMAVHTAVGLLLAAAAVLCARPDRGWAGVVSGVDNAGRLSRRLVPAVLLTPIVLQLGAAIGVRNDLFDHAYGSALLVVVLVLILCGVMILLSRSLGDQGDQVARLAETLGQSQERLAATLTGIGDGVIATDSACCVEAMNPVAEQLTGWTLSEARGKPLAEVFHIVNETSRDLVESPAERVLREGRIVGLANHTVLLSRDGSEKPIADSGAPIRNRDGQITGVVLVFRDGTEERRFAEELTARERQYRQLFTEMHDGFALHEMIWDADGKPHDYRFVDVNSAFEKLTGLDGRTIVGQTVRTVIPGIEAAWIERYGEVVRSGEPLRFEMAADALGRTYDVTSFRPAPGRFACIFTDTTERRKMVANLQVADRMVSVGTLAAGVAHEINNPLAYTTSNIDFIASQLHEMLAYGPDADVVAAPPVARVREVLAALDEAREGAQRVGRIVKDLKTFSRADDNESGEADLHSVLDLSLRLAGNQIRTRAQVAREFAVVPKVRASESRLGQVFVNLLVNAAQAIPEGQVERNEIRVTTRLESSGKVAVEVRDTGVGMTPEVLAHIFDPFFTTKEVGEGTGLGLSICHGIITGLGGDIEVSSTPGLGTLVRVLLPVAEAHATLPQAPPVEPTARRGRILIVDDEPAVAKALKRLIGAGHDVQTLTDAREALQLIQGGERFDLILSDLMMPSMTGMELHRRLAESHPELADRMVFVSGGAFSRDSQEILDRFPTRHLEKPFDLEQVRRAVKMMVEASTD